MENKTKVKIAVVIGIVVLVIIFIFMVIFVKGNQPKRNKNIPKMPNGYAQTNKNVVVDSGNSSSQKSEMLTMDNIESLAIENGNLVKINSDLKSIVVSELDNRYVDFCYGNKKVYMVCGNEYGNNSIFEIDLLQSDYPSKLIFDTGNFGAIKNIDYYVGKLYFISQRGQLVEYSISEEHCRILTNENEVSSFAINKNKNIMYVSYKPNGENPGIYVLDFTANTFSEIITLNELAGKLFFSENSLIIDVKDMQSLYLYNSESNSVVGIGADNYLKNSENHIAFFENGLLYTDGSVIHLKDFNGNPVKENWYELNDNSISDISMLSSKILQIARFDDNGKVTKSIIIDLVDGKTKESDKVYTDIVRTK